MQQQLIATRDRLDRERTRLTRITQFNARALSIEAEAEFMEATAEAVVDVFELEFGALLFLTPGEALPLRPVGWSGISSVALREPWTERIWQSMLQCRSQVALFNQDSPELVGSTIHQLVVSTCFDTTGGPVALLIGGVLQSGRQFYDTLFRKNLDGLSLLAQQVGALLQSRHDTGTIARQLEAITLSEERLALALDGGGMGLWDWNIETGSLHLSPQSIRMLGYVPGELSPSVEMWLDLIHPDDRAKSEQDVQAHLAGQTPVYSNEHRLRTRTGEWIWSLARGRVQRAADGRPTRFIGVHIDITERKAAERALRHANAAEARAREAAESANRSKSLFLANMSHEVRTPMNGVLGTLQLLQATPLSLDQRELVETAIGASNNLVALLGDILDHSKIESGKLVLESKPFCPARLAREVCTLLQPVADTRGIDLHLELSPSLPEAVDADPTRVRQVLLNLLGNALKFTTEGGVTLRLDHRGGQDPQAQLTVTVQDSGVGLTPSELERVFRPFEQADPTTTRRFGGTGLGLSISRQLVALMGGELTATSTKGVGSDFRFHIRAPAAVLEQHSRRPSPVPPPHAARKLRVLLVEDNPINQLVTTRMLQTLGVEVTLAEHGRRGLEALDRESFDLVFMDLHMPELDGLQATRIVREKEQTSGSARIPIIALTASAMLEERKICLEAGMDDVLTKPLQMADLQAFLDRYSRVLTD